MNLLRAYIIGVTIALTIGPISLLIVQRCVRKGFRSAVMTSLGVALADCTYALIASGIGTVILRVIETYERYVFLFSGIVLSVLALRIVYTALTAYHHQPRAAQMKGNDGISAYLLTLHNPMTVVVFLGFLSYMTDIHAFSGVLLFAFGLFLGSFTGQLLIGMTAFVFRGFFQNPKGIVLFDCFSAIGIAVFAVVSFLKI